MNLMEFEVHFELPSTVPSYRLRLWKEPRMERREEMFILPQSKGNVTVLGSGEGRRPMKKTRSRIIAREMREN